MNKGLTMHKGRVGLVAVVVLALTALGLYLYSERAVPPEPPVDEPEVVVEPESPASGSDDAPDETGRDGPVREPVPATDTPPVSSPPTETRELPEAEISLDEAQRALCSDLEEQLTDEQMDMVVDSRLVERFVTTFNSLDGAPVPLRFRPLAHVPDLPEVRRESDHWRLPDDPDPRYRPYRALFERLEAGELADLFEAYEPALEQAWQAMGEQREQSFRERAIEVLDHLAGFRVPQQRPALQQSEVLYEYIDPELEALSWGRKVLVRIGPGHAAAVQNKLAELSERLAGRAPEQ